MKKNLLLTLSIGALVACNSNESKLESIPTSGNSDPITKLNIQAENFEEIDSTGVLMFPLSMGQNRNSVDAKIYKDIPADQHWNILFLDTSNNVQHLLTDKKILINSYNYKYNQENGLTIPYKSKYIFYTVKSEDFNQDKVLTQDDPDYLFVSDKQGNNFRQISPKNMHIGAWKLLPNDKVVMTAYRDSNTNKEFDEQDESGIYEVIIGSNETPKEIINPNTKELIKKLYARDWKKVK